MKPLVKLALLGVLLSTLMALAAVAGTRAAGAPTPRPHPFSVHITEGTSP